MGHLVQKRQCLRSTNLNPPPPSSPEEPMSQFQSNELLIQFTSIIKLYTDDTGCFPVHSRSGHQYVMIAYHCDANLILAVPFKTRKDTHRLKSYDKIMQRLRNHNLTVDLQILDNEASSEHNWFTNNKWNMNYQLVPPNTHRSNAAERVICTFKAQFISILAVIAPDFPRNLWGLLLPQTELTLNLLRKATLYPSKLAWVYFRGPLNYDSTPLGTLGCNIIAHKKTGTRNLWYFRGTAGWNVGVALQQ